MLTCWFHDLGLTTNLVYNSYFWKLAVDRIYFGFACFSKVPPPYPPPHIPHGGGGGGTPPNMIENQSKSTKIGSQTVLKT